MKRLVTVIDAPGAPASQWKRDYERRVEAAAPVQLKLDHGRSTSYHPDGRDGTQAQRLREFGRIPVVALDTFLVFVAVVLLNLMLEAAALFVIVINGGYLAHGSSVNTAMNHATGALTGWLTSPAGLAASALATQAAILLVVQVRLVHRDLLTWADLGWRRLRGTSSEPGEQACTPWRRALAIGLGLGVLAFLVGEVLLVAMHTAGIDVSEQERSFGSAHHASLLEFIPFALTTALTAPLAEETFFRGYALRALSVRYGFPAGLAVSSALFALLHLVGGVGWVVVPLFAVGAILGWGYARTGNLLTDITAHSVNNLIGLVLLYTS